MSIRLLNGEFVQWGGLITPVGRIPVGGWFTYKSGQYSPYNMRGMTQEHALINCPADGHGREVLLNHEVIWLRDYGPRLLCQSPVSTEATCPSKG